MRFSKLRLMNRFAKHIAYKSPLGVNPRTKEGGRYGIMDGVGRHRSVLHYEILTLIENFYVKHKIIAVQRLVLELIQMSSNPIGLTDVSTVQIIRNQSKPRGKESTTIFQAEDKID